MSLYVDILSYILDEVKTKDPYNITIYPDSTDGHVTGIIEHKNGYSTQVYFQTNTTIKCYLCYPEERSGPFEIMSLDGVGTGEYVSIISQKTSECYKYRVEEPFEGIIEKIWNWLDQD